MSPILYCAVLAIIQFGISFASSTEPNPINKNATRGANGNQSNHQTGRASGLIVLLSNAYQRPLGVLPKGRRPWQRTLECGTIGSGKGTSKYPWIASMTWFKDPDHSLPDCTGSLITPRHVLTAAHCFDFTSPDKMKVIFNLDDICGSPNFETEVLPDGRESFKVTKVDIHERYAKDMYGLTPYNIAIAHLDREAVNYTPICLPDAGNPTKSSSGIFADWMVDVYQGSVGGAAYCNLALKNVQKLTKKECGDTSKLPKEILENNPTMFCSSGACIPMRGFGGPLMIENNNGRMVVSGLGARRMSGCDIGYPNTFTDVEYFIDWIIEKIGKTDRKASTVKT